MKFNVESKRTDSELAVRIDTEFVIPYEGSGEWLLKLKEMIDEHII